MQVEEIFIWEKNETKTGEFRYSMTITNSPPVGLPMWSMMYVQIFDMKLIEIIN